MFEFSSDAEGLTVWPSTFDHSKLPTKAQRVGGLPLLVVAFVSKAEAILRPSCRDAFFQHISSVFGLELIHYCSASHCGSKPEIFFGSRFVSYQSDDVVV